MPQGLQAWDGAGNMVVDIGDFSTRIMTSFSAGLAAGTRQQFYPIGGVTPTGCFAVITQGNDSVTSGLLMTELTAFAGNGGVWIVSLTTTSYARNVIVDVYQYN